jgi:hypothetical protein
VRRSLPFFVLLLATTACNRVAPDGGPAAPTAADDEVANGTAGSDLPIPPEIAAPHGRVTRESGPEVGPGTAPGVAFNYRYSFRLEAARVAEAQQEHQRICERYTVARCRIIGMTYRAANADDVEAMLAFRVDPRIAGQFGRESVQAVTAADGTLTDSEINGAEVGGAIEEAGRTIVQLEADLARIEAQLRSAGPGDKPELELQAQQLRQQIEQQRAGRDTQLQSLTTTPILFRYGSGNLAPGPAQATTLKQAFGDTGGDLLRSATLLLVVLVRLFPWALAALLLWGLFAFARRRWSAKPPAETAS